jgi:hypothetical protein
LKLARFLKVTEAEAVAAIAHRASTEQNRFNMSFRTRTLFIGAPSSLE